MKPCRTRSSRRARRSRAGRSPAPNVRPSPVPSVRRVALAVFLVVAGACGGGDEAATDETTAPTAATTSSAASSSTSHASPSPTSEPVPEPTGFWSWSGEPLAPGDDPASEVLVAKYSNAPKAWPQQGLEAADLAMEVLVEGGVPRILAVFQSTMPEAVGPLRSAREVDPKLVEPFNAFYASSGGQGAVMRDIAAVATNVSDGPGPGYYRESGRPAPYDLFVAPARLLEVAELTPTENTWLTFDDGPVAGEQALSVAVNISSFHTTNYRYSAADGGYLRFNGEQPHATVGADQLVASTVVVVFVEQLSTGRRDGAGAPVPDFDVVGSGEAVVFRDGVAIRGNWERGRTADFFRLFDADGEAIDLRPGQIWFEVVPTGRSVEWQ